MPCSPGDYVACQNLADVADVKFPAGRDAGGHNVTVAPFGEPLCHHVGPVHALTSNGHRTDETTERDTLDFVAGGLVDQNDRQHHLTAG